jgi:hypothetical protein
MENFTYYILSSEESLKCDFSQLPGYCTWESSRKSQSGDLFLLKFDPSTQPTFIDGIQSKWGPFTKEQLEIIFLEPTWRNNIFLMN